MEFIELNVNVTLDPEDITDIAQKYGISWQEVIEMVKFGLSNLKDQVENNLEHSLMNENGCLFEKED